LSRPPSSTLFPYTTLFRSAESHVDRSIESPGEFIETDVFGAFVLLEAARSAGIRHLQVSTDEVYGSIESGSFTEQSPIQPSSPRSEEHTSELQSRFDLVCR